MSTINYVIVEVEKAYNNEVVLSTGLNIVVNTTIESVEHINRKAVVVEAPDFTVLEEGDEVIIHHNILRLRNGVGGKMVSSSFHLEGNRYFVPLTEVFMYKRDGDWVCLDPFCFVKPVKAQGQELYLGKDSTHKGMEKLRGVMIHPNSQLKAMGIEKGDNIIFSPNSEYEFSIDGELCYKMATRDIMAKV